MCISPRTPEVKQAGTCSHRWDRHTVAGQGTCLHQNAHQAQASRLTCRSVRESCEHQGFGWEARRRRESLDPSIWRREKWRDHRVQQTPRATSLPWLHPLLGASVHQMRDLSQADLGMPKRYAVLRCGGATVWRTGNSFSRLFDQREFVICGHAVRQLTPRSSSESSLDYSGRGPVSIRAAWFS